MDRTAEIPMPAFAARHEHNWIVIRRVDKIVDGENVTYIFYECVNPGCPNPNRMDIERHG